MRTAAAGGSLSYTGDYAPLSRLATLSLRTITPLLDRDRVPDTVKRYRIPCSIVEHKPCMCARSFRNEGPHLD